MNDSNDKILRQKEKLAVRTLQVAENSLNIIEATLDECSTDDLIKIFNSSVRAHKEFLADVATLLTNETKAEKELSKEYKGAAAELISRFKPSPQN